MRNYSLVIGGPIIIIISLLASSSQAFLFSQQQQQIDIDQGAVSGRQDNMFKRFLPAFIRSSSSSSQQCSQVCAITPPPGTVIRGGGVSAVVDTSSVDLNTIELKRVIDETSPLSASIKAGSLWKDRGAIVFVVRRPGCHLCREEALDLSGLLPSLDQPRPRLVAVIAERTSSGEFISKCFKGGEVFLDEGRGFMESLGDRWLGLTGLLRPSVWKNGKRATKKYPELKGDLKGEGRRLGGLYVIGRDSNIHLQYREGVFGDHAPLQQVVAAVKRMQGK